MEWIKSKQKKVRENRAMETSGSSITMNLIAHQMKFINAVSTMIDRVKSANFVHTQKIMKKSKKKMNSR